MIHILASKHELLISGHENSNAKNQLICAAVSAIALTGLNTFFKKDLKFVTKKGFLKVRLLNYSYRNQIKWKMLINQLYCIYLNAIQHRKEKQISWN